MIQNAADILNKKLHTAGRMEITTSLVYAKKPSFLLIIHAFLLSCDVFFPRETCFPSHPFILPSFLPSFLSSSLPSFVPSFLPPLLSHSIVFFLCDLRFSVFYSLTVFLSMFLSRYTDENVYLCHT